MKLIAITLALSFVFINSAQAGSKLPELEIINTDNQRWYFRQVTVNKTEIGLRVSGRMDAHLRYGLPRGHVDIAAWSADNSKLIAETTAAYSPRFLTKRAVRKGGVRFSAKLPILPADALIKVAFHRNKPKQATNPAHDRTVAR